MMMEVVILVVVAALLLLPPSLATRDFVRGAVKRGAVILVIYAVVFVSLGVILPSSGMIYHQPSVIAWRMIGWVLPILSLLLLPPIMVLAVRDLIRGARRRGVMILVVYLAVIAALAAMFPVARERERRSRCTDTLRSPLGCGMSLYAMDHDGCFPSNWADLYPYALNPKCFVCPSSGTVPGPTTNVDEWADFVLVANMKESDPPGAIHAFCPPKNHNGAGANVVYVDTSAQWLTASQFANLLSDPCLFFGTTASDVVTELQHRVTIRPPYDSVLHVPPTRQYPISNVQ